MLAMVVVVILALVLCLPWLLGGKERIELDPKARAAMTGHSFVALSDGATHYQWGGPEQGTKVVLVHGFSSPMFIFDRVFQALADAGLRVLRYDLYGRGLSDRPRVRYNANLFDRQLAELLDSQGVTEPIHVVGLSMGGAIVAHFLDRHPERVGHVALFAPAGLNELGRGAHLLKTPGLGDWLIKALGDRILMKMCRGQAGDDPEAVRRFEAEYDKQLQYKGYKRALLSTMRHGPLEGQHSVYERIGRLDRAGAVFWGTADAVVPFELHRELVAFVPWLDLHAIDAGTHTAVYLSADEIIPPLLEFLKQ